MREIRFREWETERKSMSYSTREDFDDMVGFRFLHTEGGKRILMQYTGLKDKNGREIYEGDIIRCLTEGYGYVLMRSGAFGIETIFGFYPFYELYGDTEVIGNIYENPELLGVEK